MEHWNVTMKYSKTSITVWAYKASQFLNQAKMWHIWPFQYCWSGGLKHFLKSIRWLWLHNCTFNVLCECKFHRLNQSCIWVNNSAPVWMPNTESHPCLDETLFYNTITVRIGFKWSVQSLRLWTCPIACQPILSLTNGSFCAGRRCALDFFAQYLSHIQ